MADFSSTIYTLANSLIGQLFVLIYGWHTSKVDIGIYIKKTQKCGRHTEHHAKMVNLKTEELDIFFYSNKNYWVV